MASRVIEVAIIGDASSLQRALGKATSATEAFGTRMKATGRTLTHTMTFPLVAAGAASVKFAVDFQRSMELVHTQAGASQKEVEKMSKAILALAPTVATGPNELAKALFHIESVGLRGAKALDALRTAALGAKVGQADLEATTNALAAAQVVQIQGTKNVGTTMATLNAIVGVGNMRMNDLASAMGSGILPVAKNFGLSLRSVGAALATLTDAGVPAVDAATRLRMSFALMGAPTSKATAELKKIHLSATALANAMRKPDGLVGAITLLRDHLQGLSKTQQAALLTGAFGGGRSSATIITLVNNLDRLGKKYNDIGAGIGKYGDAVRKTTQTAQFKFEKSLAQLQATGIKIGADLIPILVSIAGVVATVAAAFDGLSGSTQKWVLIGAGVLAVLGPLLSVLGSVTIAVGFLATGFTALAAGEFLALAPIALIALAIAALAVGFVIAYKKSATFRAIVQEALHAVASATNTALDGLRQLAPLFDVIKQVASIALRGLVVEFHAVVAAMRIAIAGFKVVWNVGVTAFHAVGSAINGVIGIARGVYSVIQSIIRAVMDLVHAAEAAKNFLTSSGANSGITPGHGGHGVLGARAMGGPVNAGTLYRVNENRQEYFRPSGSGSVVPIAPGGSGGLTLNLSFPNALVVDGKSVKQAVSLMLPELNRQMARRA